MLASEYGWSKTDILEKVYFDELFLLQDEIKKRHVLDWKMQLVIGQNPHIEDESERQKLWDELDGQIDGGDKNSDFDRAGMEILKTKMAQNPKIIVK